MEMEMRKESEDEQRMKKGKGKEADPFVFIPDDILSDILKRVPDVFLRCKAKHVCRRWFNTITNRILLDHVSLILQNEKTHIARVVDISDELGEGQQVKEHNLDIPIKGKIRSWCNEFLLISHYKEGTSCLYLYNQITKEGSYLPVFNSYCGSHASSRCGVALSFDRSKGIYKAVHLCVGPTIECQILILGQDVDQTITVSSSKWKKIEVPYVNEGQIRGDPVSVQGRYMNWKFYYTNDLVCVDMVKEEVCIISLPKSSCSVFEMGGCLALLDDISRNEIELWVLKDFQRVKWEKLKTITNGDYYFYRYPGRVYYYRICGMVSKRYLILKSNVGMYSYDLKSGIAEKLDIHIQNTHIHSDDERCVFAPSFI